MSRIFDDDIYTFDRVPRHYWAATAGAAPDFADRRLTTDIAVDAAVIGGGYTGLFAAHRLASRHELSVAVLEAGCVVGWGASGMNGGFVSMGGAKLSTGEMVRRVGEAETRRYWQSQAGAVEELREFIDSHNIACSQTGDGVICMAHHPRAAAELAHEGEALRTHFGISSEYLDAETVRREIHDGPETFGALRVRPGFGIHPTRLVRGVAQSVAEQGVEIFTGTAVRRWERHGAKHRLTTADGIGIEARRIVLATNAYAPMGLHAAVRFRVAPAISSIIVTEPFTAAELDRSGPHDETPIYNSRNLLSYYRRLPDGRILFGERGDTTGSKSAAIAQAECILASLRHKLPQLAGAKIAYSWRGLVALTLRRTLALGLDPDDPTVAFAYGCQGSGVATMSWAGRHAGDLLAGTARDADIPALFRGAAMALPRSPLILRSGLRAAYVGYGLRDRFAI